MEENNTFYEERLHFRGNFLLGIGVFLLAVVTLRFVTPFVTQGMGAWGTVVGELLLAALPVGIALLLRMDMKEVFPFRAIKGRQLGGTVLLWMGSFGLVMMVLMLVVSLMPEQLAELTETGEGITTAYGNLAFLPLLLVLAISPAVCEEILTRGMIQYNFGRLNKWVCIFLTGILFGILHLDPLRILSASLLGIMLSYLRQKTGNLWLPMIYHFINNAVSSLSVYLSGAYALLLANSAVSAEVLTALTESSSTYAFTGFFFGMGAPFLLLAGVLLLEPPRPLGRHKYRDKRLHFIAATIATILIVFGMFYSLAQLVKEGDFFDMLPTDVNSVEEMAYTLPDSLVAGKIGLLDIRSK